MFMLKQTARRQLALTLVLISTLLLSACRPITAPASGGQTEPLSTAPEVTAGPATTLDEASTIKIDDMITRTMQELQIPGMAVGVIKDGQIVYAKGFGVAEAGSARPVTPQSVFLLASLAKSLTATALFQLAEQGKLDLDTPVVQYVPYFQMDDPLAATITVRQLMSHLSGIQDPEEEWFGTPDSRFWSEVDKHEDDDGALERHLHELATIKLAHAPGEPFIYSQDGYDLLGALIAKVSDQPFEVYMHDHVLGPLGMTHTTYLLSDVAPELLVSGHMRDNENRIIHTPSFPYVRSSAPAAMLFSTLEDMLRWATVNLSQGKMDGARILSEANYDLMWNMSVETGWPAPFDNYGYGWFKSAIGNHRIVWNAGDFVGFLAAMVHAPDDDMAVVVMANYRTGFQVDPFYNVDISEGILKLLLGIE